MSKEYLTHIIESVTQCTVWSIQVLKFNHKARNGKVYNARQIAIEPEKKVRKHIEEISSYYVGEGMERFDSVVDYTGDYVNHGIYKLNNLVQSELKALFSATAAPDTETPLDKFDYNALLFKGTIQVDDVDKSVFLVSIQKPISILTNKFRFLHNKKKFHEIDDPVLTLRSVLDVIIVGNDVFLMGLAGEKFFHLDSTAKAVCKQITEDISDCGIFDDPESFKSLAQKGHNPRRFLAYNERHLNALMDSNMRKEMSKKFRFPLDDKGKIKTKDEKSVANLVKFLCNKGMIDPVDGNPMEVAASRPWGSNI